MADSIGTVKGTAKKNKQDALANRSLLYCGTTPLSAPNSSRLSLISSARLQKATSSSLEKLSFISEKEDSNDLENYHLEYSTYLLRKIQSHLLAQSKEQKEENVKRCLISLKLEFEGLLDKHVKLRKEVGHLKVCFEVIREINKKIEEGNKILKFLTEDKYEKFMTCQSISLDHIINQLQLVDIEKSSIMELFNEKVWGYGSELDDCLMKINAFISKNQDEVSNIATELVEIKKLSSENALLRERLCLAFEKFSNEFLETNYKLFSGIVKKAFNQRQECRDSTSSNSLNCDLTELMQSVRKTENEQFTFQLSNLDCSYPVTPNSASTPQLK